MSSLKSTLPFQNVLIWIFLAAYGGVLVYMDQYIERHEWQLFLAYGIAFSFYLLLLYCYQPQWFIRFLVAGFIIRALFLLSTPSLSDDYHRFLWDGALTHQNISPYSSTPNEIQGYVEMPEGLFDQLNSPNYYSVYPPASQLVFTLCYSVAPNHPGVALFVMRVLFLLFEGALFFIMWYLSRKQRVQSRKLFLYFLNPLVILEIQGNLHFEGMMIFFLFLGIALLQLRKTLFSGISWGLAVGVKLIPLIYLPLLLRRQSPSQWIKLYSAVVGVVFILFLPFGLYDSLAGMMDSLSLFFRKFEFNASLYYLFREYGYYRLGYNNIAEIGPLLSKITLVVVISYALIDWIKDRPLMESMMFTGLLYYLFATTVHPWYIIPLMAFSVFTRYNWPLYWSFMIFFSYSGYTESGFAENLWVQSVEYILLLGIILYELRNPNRNNLLIRT